MKREKTKYPGVTYREQERLDGKGMEKMYYIRYRRGGRGSKETEEPCGRETEGMTAAKANAIRAMRMTAKEETNKERRQAQEIERQKGDGPLTLGRLWEIYSKTLEDKPIQKRDDTGRAYHLESLFNKRIDELATKDVDKLALKLTKTQGRGRSSKGTLSPQTQKHTLALLKRLLHYAERQGLCPYPTGLVITMPKVDNQKTESMTAEQMTAYWKALDEEPDQSIASILKVALLTGIRKSALLSLQWSDIDFERDTICLRGESAKSGKTQHIPLNDAVKSVLLSIERVESNDLVWPSPETGGVRKNVYHVADRVRNKAGLPKDFRPMHGLRHAFASHLASSGQVDLYTLQKLLTHGSPQMTQRYAHLADEALKRAANVANGMVRIDS
ncbi:MAG: site-specific integrase [Desulfovibrio sp.]|nr:site-specific integrase [Desulfovibrio sp.]